MSTITTKAESSGSSKFISPDVANTANLDNTTDLSNYKIRKVQANECLLLMGFEQADYNNMSQVVKDSKVYKQSGNSIVVDVLESIFKDLYK